MHPSRVRAVHVASLLHTRFAKSAADARLTRLLCTAHAPCVPEVHFYAENVTHFWTIFQAFINVFAQQSFHATLLQWTSFRYQSVPFQPLTERLATAALFWDAERTLPIEAHHSPPCFPTCDLASPFFPLPLSSLLHFLYGFLITTSSSLAFFAVSLFSSMWNKNVLHTWFGTWHQNNDKNPVFLNLPCLKTSYMHFQSRSMCDAGRNSKLFAV